MQSELNDRVLLTLTRIGRGMKASGLTRRLQVAQHDVVGRLLVLPCGRLALKRAATACGRLRSYAGNVIRHSPMNSCRHCTI